jgi:hypothetical protein
MPRDIQDVQGTVAELIRRQAALLRLRHPALAALLESPPPPPAGEAPGDVRGQDGKG